MSHEEDLQDVDAHCTSTGRDGQLQEVVDGTPTPSSYLWILRVEKSEHKELFVVISWKEF